MTLPAYGTDNPAYRHGLYGTAIYSVWLGIIQRCENPNSPNYARYGGRGISICERWRRSVKAFYTDVGDRPTSAHQIERKDNDGNYEPGNCVWATPKEQANNRSSSVILTHNGKSQSVSAWAVELGLTRRAITQRLAMGWPLARALSPEKAHKQYSLTYRGETKPAHVWAKELGLPYPTLFHRIGLGWSDEKILTAPNRYARSRRVPVIRGDEDKR